MDLRSVRRKKRAARALTWVSAAVIIACMAGLIVGLILMGTGNGNTARENLFLIIGGCCLAVLLIAALASVGFYRLSEKYESQETDLRERACSENSFFAGDDLLATFGADGVRFHAAPDARGKISREVRVPYKDMKIYSIINRRSPRAKGESVVLLEIPTRFFPKGGIKRTTRRLLWFVWTEKKGSFTPSDSTARKCWDCAMSLRRRRLSRRFSPFPCP